MLVGATATVALVVSVTLGAGPGGRAVARAEEQRPAGHAPSKADGHATAREPAFSAPDPVVTVGWVGDTALGSRSAGAPAQGGRALFASVRGLLRRPDILIGNLEGTFGTRGASKCPSGTPNCFAFQAPPATARALS